MTEAVAETIKAHCPTCDRAQNCSIRGAFDQSWEHIHGEHHTNGQQEHKLLQCCGCDQVFYHRSSRESEDFDFDWNPRTQQEELEYIVRTLTYPEPEKKSGRPAWAWDLHKRDATLAKILWEMYEARDRQSLILASVGMRTALDRAVELLGIDPGHTLEEKLSTLLRDGFVGETEHMTLSVVVDAGNAAAHRAWAPSADEFNILLVTLEQFIDRTIVSGKEALAVKDKIPPRQPRPRRIRATDAGQ